MGWLGRIRSILEFGDNYDVLLAEVLRRKHWKRLPKQVISRIFENSKSPIFDKPNEGSEVLRSLVFVSEQYGLVKKNFIPIAASEGGDLGMILGLFSITLYRLGSDCVRAVPFVGNEDQYRTLVASADMAFTSAVLCDTFYLGGYVGMASLYGTIHVNKKVGLEWCAKFRKAEDLLRHTPESQLTHFQRAQKHILDPGEMRRLWTGLRQHAPQLVPTPDPPEGTPREIIDQIEATLLSL